MGSATPHPELRSSRTLPFRLVPHQRMVWAGAKQAPGRRTSPSSPNQGEREAEVGLDAEPTGVGAFPSSKTTVRFPYLFSSPRPGFTLAICPLFSPTDAFCNLPVPTSLPTLSVLPARPSFSSPPPRRARGAPPAASGLPPTDRPTDPNQAPGSRRAHWLDGKVENSEVDPPHNRRRLVGSPLP